MRKIVFAIIATAAVLSAISLIPDTITMSKAQDLKAVGQQKKLKTKVC